jgi:hypothetical protein
MIPRFSNPEGGNCNASYETLQENLSTRPNLESQYHALNASSGLLPSRTVTKFGRKSDISCSGVFFFSVNSFALLKTNTPKLNAL